MPTVSRIYTPGTDSKNSKFPKAPVSVQTHNAFLLLAGIFSSTRRGKLAGCDAGLGACAAARGG